MQDLKLDFENKRLLNEVVDRKERVIQHITVSVRTWMQDFFLNQYFGIDYTNAWDNLTLLELYIREQVEAISGVFSVNFVKVAKGKDHNNRTYINVDVNLTYDNEIIDISEQIMGR